jgi:hypothetical protein
MARCLHFTRRRGRAVMTVIVAIGSSRAHGAPEESRTQLLGSANIDGVHLANEVGGDVRMIIHGTGDISDECPDADRRAFVSELDGRVVIAPDGSFAVDLFPFSPAVATPSGCEVTNVAIERIDSVTITVGVPALDREGIGWIDFQTLSSVDNDELQRGDYGTLHTSLYFPPPKPKALA